MLKISEGFRIDFGSEMGQIPPMKIFAIAGLLMMGLSSCNTFIGMGRDIRQMGEGMEHVAHGKRPDGSEKTRNQQDVQQPTQEEALPTY